ncbi:transcription initiation factor TFIID subunit 4b-like [Chenopodium quinoa]|uniref:transcription initiation factor TFIID subunit 4b-like n=1 Tax=Chenopodium quinoa TaxID=63459 RepID=UPI000B77EFBD|nr:transcription initiation factor TFIID subunit 4b-like [Chenopodium quinoa]XP_021768794.1 transcription initiation factor TFIID subunit 4b-like [Chenopodium quinoa]
MDPSIMKLLEEDEDESMHSGADVEAFTAALNRDIEGDSSSSRPVHPDISFSQENNQTSSQIYTQWQPSSQDENSGSQSQQQGLRSQEQQSSDVEMKEHESNMEIQQEVNETQAPSASQSQLHRPVQVDGQEHPVEPKSGEYSQPSTPMQPQVSGSSHTQAHETSRMLNSSSEPQFSNMQRFSNQPVSGPEQAGTSSNRSKQIPFGSLLPIILPELDKDRAMQLQTLYGKLRRNEIPKDTFVRLMRGIVGDQMLRLAVVKMQAKSQNPGQQPHLRPPTGTAAQFSDPYSFGQLHQKSHSTPTVTRTPAPVLQPVKDSGHQMADSNSLKSREMEKLSDSHGVQANQTSDRSAISIQGLSKQQQQHLHFPQGSFPMYGASSYLPFSNTNVSTPPTLTKPQSHDPQVRQGQLHQGFGAAYGDGTSQAMNVMTTPKVERQNSFNDPKKVPGVTMANMPTPVTQHTSVPWQVSKEQKIGTSPNISYVKQEPSEQALERQPKPQVSSSQGTTFSGSVLVDQGESLPVASNDELSERHNPGIAFQSSSRIATMPTGSVPSRMDTDFQVGSQTIAASPLGGIGSNSKVSTKKPSSGQKKPLDALDSSPPLPSKKQKASGAFSDQSIEHLNDVAAVSGINMREEEEQLFSVPKDDSRVSEASRKAVQEEEDRLILQKAPLQKKLAEIMTKCGLKNLSNDVERCLSLCVEERLRALISNLIRVSKQRADSEKSRHAIVVTSDVREQILEINRKAREEWEKKQAEDEKLRKQNEPDSSAIVDADKEKDDGRAKSLKMPVNKEEDDKLRTTAANVAARAAVGGDDMLSKWQLMAQQARQKRDGGPEIPTSSQAGKDATNKQFTTSVGNVRETRGTGKRDTASALSASGVGKQGGRSQVAVPPPRVTPRISVKDVISVLEKEPQMAKSTIIYRLYDKMHGDPAAE